MTVETFHLDQKWKNWSKIYIVTKEWKSNCLSNPESNSLPLLCYLMLMYITCLAHMARARLRDRHQENLRRKLEVLKAEQAVTVPAVAEPSTSQKEDKNTAEDAKPSTSDAQEENLNFNER